MIGSSTRPEAPPFRSLRRRRLLASTSALRVPIASAALALGVALSGEAHAQAVVNPVQTTTYTINPASNPITFGSATNINTSLTFNSNAVVGNAGTSWDVTVNAGGRPRGQPERPLPGVPGHPEQCRQHHCQQQYGQRRLLHPGRHRHQPVQRHDQRRLARRQNDWWQRQGHQRGNDQGHLHL